MPPTISIQYIPARKLAAVHRQVQLGGVAAACRPALDMVWAFLRENPGLRSDGHNVFFYRHPERRGEPMEVDFGVEVTRSFGAGGEVREVDTPAGEAALARHIGSYERLRDTHLAIHAWLAANNRLSAVSLEIYGDWCEDASKLETTVIYLLTP